MKKLNCYKTVKWILSALPFFLYIWTPTCLCAIQRFHRAACAGTVQIWKGLGFPNKYFAEQSLRLRAERSNESPSGAFKRRSGLAQQDGGALPRQVPPRCTECRQCKEKHGFPAGVQKVCKSVQSPRKWKIQRRILRFFIEFLRKASWFFARQFLHPLSYFASQSAHCIPWNRAKTVQKSCTYSGTNDDFWSMTWWRFEWPQG